MNEILWIKAILAFHTSCYKTNSGSMYDLTVTSYSKSIRWRTYKQGKILFLLNISYTPLLKLSFATNVVKNIHHNELLLSQFFVHIVSSPEKILWNIFEILFGYFYFSLHKCHHLNETLCFCTRVHNAQQTHKFPMAYYLSPSAWKRKRKEI